jgi:hypothetical protein
MQHIFMLSRTQSQQSAGADAIAQQAARARVVGAFGTLTRVSAVGVRGGLPRRRGRGGWSFRSTAVYPPEE